VAQVLQLLKLPDGTIKVLVEGVSRAAITGYSEREGALTAQGRLLEPRFDRNERELEVTVRSLLSLFEQYVKTNRKIPPELLSTLSGIDDPSRLADTIAAHLAIRLADKQKLLEAVEVGARLEMLIGFVDGEIDVQQLEKRIRGRVKSQMEKSQREYYLNEQMKAIQKELGRARTRRTNWRSWPGRSLRPACRRRLKPRPRPNSTSSSRCRRCRPRRRWCATTWTGCSACRGRSAARFART
jgi:ATP-dependent Lon protease